MTEASDVSFRIFEYKMPECCICKEVIEDGFCTTEPKNKKGYIHTFCFMYALQKGAFEDLKMNKLVEEYMLEKQKD